MLEQLRAHDANMVELECGQASVLIPPSLNGRVFCQLDGELVHRLDGEALRHPSLTEYDNLGGNSLWPAPEGGPFAFNYPPGGGAWYVQEAVSKVVPSVTRAGGNRAAAEKRVSLTNRKGVCLMLKYRRVVSIPDRPSSIEGYALRGMCYETEDAFEPLGDYRSDDVLLAPWSLEQFPGAEGIVAFGKVADSEDALNQDFYGSPGDRIVRRPGCFTFRLGGKDRHQIGVKVTAMPQCIGALDPHRLLLILRRTRVQEGLYFNIADNEQPAGPFSAADAYSIFNGGELGFFELETIGTMQTGGGLLKTSTLFSQTVILKGRLGELLRYLSEREGLDIHGTVTGSHPGGE